MKLKDIDACAWYDAKDSRLGLGGTTMPVKGVELVVLLTFVGRYDENDPEEYDIEHVIDILDLND